MKPAVHLLHAALLVLVSSSAALAEEPRDDRWSVGAGIALGGYGGMNIGQLMVPVGLLTAGVSYGYPQYALPTTQVAASAERAFTRSLWLRLGLAAGHGSYDFARKPAPASYQQTSDLDGATATFGLSAGPLYWFNPGGAVEIGMFAALTASHASYEMRRVETLQVYSESPDSTTRTTTSRGTGFAVGAEVGLGFQRQLTEHLFVRLSSAIAHATYLEQTVTEAVATRTTSSGIEESSSRPGTGSDFQLSAAFAPWLELRLAF